MGLRNVFGRFKEFLLREFSFITGNYQILVMSWIIMDISNEMPQPYFQQFVNDILGGSAAALGLVGLANFLGMAAVAFPGGYLADKYGRRRLITTMTFGMALSFLFFAFAPTWHFVLLGALVSSLCLIYQPALFAMVQDSLPPERRGMGSSIIMLIHGAISTPGPMFAGLLFLMLGLEWSMRFIYLLMTGLYLGAAVLRLRLKETVTNGEPMRFRYFVSSYPKAVRESFGVWKFVPRTVLWIFSVRTLVMFGLSLIQVINALYAERVLGVPRDQWWLVYIPLLLTMVVASLPIGKAVDKFGRKAPIILGLVLFVVGTVVFIIGDIVMLMVSMSLFGLAQMMVMAGVMALSTDLIEPENRGKVVGFNNFVGYIASGMGMLLGGFLFENFVPQSPFVINLGVVCVALVIVMFLIREPKERVGATMSA